MPFTFAHPAAVLPFPRKHLVFSAMVVGSMSPDFYYFALIPDVQRCGHSLRGLFLFCIPVGLAMLWLFHKVFKKPLLSLAPAHLRSRVAAGDLEFRFGPASRLGWIVLSLVLGWVTHIAWDSFTHANGLMVERWEVLQSRIAFWPHVYFFSSLQVVSSGLGLLILAWSYWRWCQRTAVVESPAVLPVKAAVRNMVIGSAVVAAIAFGVLNGMQFADHFPKEWLRVFAVRMIVACITAGFLEVVAFSIYWHLAKAKPRKPSSGAKTRGAIGAPAFQD